MRTLLKRVAATTAGLGLAFSVVAATDLPATAASGCSITYGSYNTIKKGSHGSQARAVECLLDKAGFNSSVNGRFTGRDVSALKKFQASKKIKATGKTNRATWSALVSQGDTPALKSGDSSSSVRRLEAALRASGYKLRVNNHYTAGTVQAVKAVQKAKRWTVTGTADAKVWNALQAGTATKKLAKATKKSTSSASSAGSSKGKRALAFAKRQLGDRYRYGGSGPSVWDCSGLTRGAWKSVGVSLPHSAAAQFHKGKKVSKSDLRPGDLVFFYSGIRHVAIYAGNGKVIHASQPGKPVAYIQMKYMPYQGARRP